MTLKMTQLLMKLNPIYLFLIFADLEFDNFFIDLFFDIFVFLTLTELFFVIVEFDLFLLIFDFRSARDGDTSSATKSMNKMNRLK